MPLASAPTHQPSATAPARSAATTAPDPATAPARGERPGQQRGDRAGHRTGDAEHGGGRRGIDLRAASYQPLANKIGALNPDLVYFGGTSQTNGGKLLKDLRDAGLSAAFMSVDGVFETAFLNGAGEAAEGAYVTFGGVPPDKLTGASAEWYANYKRRYSAEPEAYAAYSYEATRVALDAIRRAGAKDREAIRAALMSTAYWNGLLGTRSFDQNGEVTIKKMSGLVVRNGRFEFVSTLRAD